MWKCGVGDGVNVCEEFTVLSMYRKLARTS